jgi:hypothetical protein
MVQVFYSFGDASRKQFWATLLENYNCQGRLDGTGTNSSGIHFQIGLWLPEEEEESSNYKELRNLVDTVSEEAMARRLKNCKLFVLTDKSTVEGCIYPRNSKSPYLHALVLDLQTLEMTYGMTIHFVHISGCRMFAQGTDGCSRRTMMEGVIAGQDKLSFIDLACMAVKRHPPLLTWVCSWTGWPKLEPLTPKRCFEEGHGIRVGLLDKHKI